MLNHKPVSNLGSSCSRFIKFFKKLLQGDPDKNSDSDEEDENRKEQRIRWLLYPSDRLKMVWDLIISLSLVYLAIFVPLELAYELNGDMRLSD
jgi:hypothetical protein